ncbi:MAG: glycine zipper 2TM domain-containing protein [Sphingomonas sp.]|nr:glycine zipper 2TM domain-containing protein [Sphingomonas sp.]
MSRNDRVYRGRDGRYYCRRNDGTTGLIVGGLGGGVLGNLIAPGGSKTLGTILGGLGGAAIGTSVDRNQVTCR